MIKDMALGLQHMAGQNAIHLDFKAPNCFVGVDGTTKIADFGTGKLARAADANDLASVDNPYYSAPEILLDKHLLGALKIGIDTSSKGIIGRGKDELRSLLPNASTQTINLLAESVMFSKAQMNTRGNVALGALTFYDASADLWGLGASALEMFTGKLPGEISTFMTDASKILENYAERRIEPLADRVDEKGVPLGGSVGVKTGHSQIDDLLTHLLRANPKERATPSQVLKSEAIQSPGVGSAEAKALLVAIKRNDQNAIQEAKAALDRMVA
jgi:serine/threonine protein kinase